MSTQILLAEDDAVARRMLTDVLTSAGYRVTQVADGAEALQLLVPGAPYDVVVSDIRMAGADGIQVLRAARALPRPPAVILLTGYGTLDSSIAALRDGASDYLLKPFDLSDLLECVGGALRRRVATLQQSEAIRTLAQALDEFRGTEPHIREEPVGKDADRFLRVGAVVIDRHRHAVTYEGVPLHVTPIQYALLSCLGEAEGRVLGYTDIVRRTHGISVSESEAQLMLKAHLRHLRRKIDPAYLVNVRGTGYMLVDPAETHVFAEIGDD
jgi:DNA-binding response OmpR family regulator